jgi:hypothetical protein
MPPLVRRRFSVHYGILFADNQDTFNNRVDMKSTDKLLPHLLVLAVGLSAWGLAMQYHILYIADLAKFVSWIAAISVVVMVVVDTIAYVREHLKGMRPERSIANELDQSPQKATPESI